MNRTQFQQLASAGLEVQRLAEAKTNSNFGFNWLIVKDWNEQARYRKWTEPLARELFVAVTDRREGILLWIKNRW